MTQYCKMSSANIAACPWSGSLPGAPSGAASTWIAPPLFREHHYAT